MRTREGGSLAEFEAAALPHLNHLSAVATAVLGDRTEAEDAVQEAYLEAWKSFRRFTPGTNCRAWLLKILFHVISHHRRKWANRFRLVGGVEQFDRTPARSSPPGELTDEEILEALRKLPSQFAEVVVLADVEELTCKEIEKTLGIPIGTVMSRLSRGRRLLQTELSSFAAAVAAVAGPA